MDDLGDLHLSSANWIDRRVDRFEFAGLTTIQHSVTLTLDLSRLRGTSVLLPIGMFGRERPPSQVIDAAGDIVRHLASEDANALMRAEMQRRLADVGLSLGVAEALDQIAHHRTDRCAGLTTSAGKNDGYADLAREKWGCPAVAELLLMMRGAGIEARARNAIVRLLFDWQNCHPLVVEVSTDNARFSTLIVSFDEELTPWFSPWDRRWTALRSSEIRAGDEPLRDSELAVRVSRGGPFGPDLEPLARPGLRGWLAGRRWARIRRIGASNLRHLTWHVAWEQWAVGAFERHIEVVVPPELSVVRLRSLRPPSQLADTATPEVASQLGPRARLTLAADGREAPELMSLLLCHRDRQSWNTGALVALLTGILLTLAVWLDLPRLDHKLEPTIAVILLGPAFTAGLLSARATSEVADALLVGLRRLHACVALCIALSAAFLVATDSLATKIAVSALALLLVAFGLLLLSGARRSRHLHREARERESPADFRPDQPRLAGCAGRQRTPRPDSFVVSGEGERLPWGWFENASGKTSPDLETYEEDRRYWAQVRGAVEDRSLAATLIASGRVAALRREE